MRKFLFYAGLGAIGIGVVWMGQGSGYFPYPRSSFMISEMPWFYRGLVLVVAGVVDLLLLRRF
jgi:hypothetical protein